MKPFLAPAEPMPAEAVLDPEGELPLFVTGRVPSGRAAVSRDDELTTELRRACPRRAV